MGVMGEGVVACAGWAGAFVALASYAISIARRQPIIFAWGSIISMIVLVPVYIVRDAWYNVAMSVAFGGVAVYGVVRWRER